MSQNKQILKPVFTPPPKKKSILSRIRQYLYDSFSYSGIHGWMYCFEEKNHIFERFVWFSVMFGFGGAATYLCLTTWDRYQADPVVVSLENYDNDWNGTVPAITYCYHERIDFDKADEFIQRTWMADENDTSYEHYMEFIGLVVNISSDNLHKFGKFVNDERFSSIDMLELARELHPNYDDAITSFDKGAEVNFVEVITERGICYTINSPLSVLLSTMIQLNDFKIVEKPMSCLFSKNKCFINIDLYDSAISYAVHSPYDLPVENMGFTEMMKQDEIEAIYAVVETVADSQVRTLTPKQRKCLFPDEPSKMSTLPVYGVKYCGVLCKAMKSIELCGCKPFYYPFINGQICTVEGLTCLASKGWPGNITANCECPKPCTEVLFVREVFKRHRWSVDGSGITFVRKTACRWEILSPNFRLRRDVLFSFEDLLVSFGGIATLFLGFSIWNLWRLAYFIVRQLIENLK
uniref:CSON011689 protein n=1 Tax=Culicoides sonorensis TaxID=179676 RepID=A0A336K102_CULSO